MEFMNKYHLRRVNQTLVEQIVEGLFKHLAKNWSLVSVFCE